MTDEKMRKIIRHLRHPLQEGDLDDLEFWEDELAEFIDWHDHYGFHGTLHRSWLRIRKEGIRTMNKPGNTYLIADRQISDKDIYSNAPPIGSWDVVTREIGVGEYLARLHESLLEVLDWTKTKQTSESEARGIVILDRDMARFQLGSLTEYRGIGFLSREGLLDEGSLTMVGSNGTIPPESIVGYIRLSEKESALPEQEAGNILIRKFYRAADEHLTRQEMQACREGIMN